MAKLQMQHAVAEVTQHRFAESLPHLTQLREWRPRLYNLDRRVMRWPLAGDPEVLMVAWRWVRCSERGSFGHEFGPKRC